MKIERVPLLDALNILKPALATKDLIEELSHVWFDGKSAMAYNDAELGIQVPLETPFVGGIRGALLLGLLHNSRAKDLTLEKTGEGQMLLKAARTKATISVLDLERSPWQFPQLNKKKSTCQLDEVVLEAIGSVLIGVGKDTSIPETLGVTFEAKGDGWLSLYATDSANVIAAMTLKKTWPKGRWIVPTAFCEQLLKICADGGLLDFRNDCVIAVNEESGVQLYARLVDTRKPLNFREMIDKHSKFPKGSKFEIPERLSLALDRMGVLFEGLVGESMQVSLGGGQLLMLASVNGRGELKDSVVIPEGVPNLEFRTEPGLIRRGLDLTQTMACSEDAVRMSSDDGFIYLVSNAVPTK